VRHLVPLLGLLTVACAGMPPRIDDRRTPEQAWRTFQGAVAREEYHREWACLDDRLRERLGFRSGLDYQTARVVVLDDDHPLIRAIRSAGVAGPAERTAADRATLELTLLFGHRARVKLRARPVLRMYEDPEKDPAVYRILRSFAPELAEGDGAGVLALPLDPDNWEAVRDSLDPGVRISWVEAGSEWFLEDFEVGERDPAAVRAELDARQARETTG